MSCTCTSTTATCVETSEVSIVPVVFTEQDEVLTLVLSVEVLATLLVVTSTSADVSTIELVVVIVTGSVLKIFCVCIAAADTCAQILGELEVLIPPLDTELETVVLVAPPLPPEATVLPVAWIDVPDVVPLTLAVAV